MGMLTASQIQKDWEAGVIEITPFDPAQLNINSYDLRIGDTYKIIKTAAPGLCMDPHNIRIDTKEIVEYEERDIPEYGMQLQPGELYLIPTLERVGTDYYIPMVTGRSSLGRIGVSVHCEAGFGDIGYHGVWTLQLKSTYKTVIYPYTRVAQVYFMTPVGEIDTLYHGKYQGAAGASGSKLHVDLN